MPVAADTAPASTAVRVPWSRLAPQFQANLPAFDRRTGLATAVEQHWRAAVRHCQLYQSPDAGFQIFSSLPDLPGWLPAAGPLNRLSDLAALKNACAGRIVLPLALNGLGLGYVLRDVWEATHRTFLTYSAPLIVIEPSLLAWAVVLHLFDWRAPLAEPRLRLCAGPDALWRLDEELADIDQHVPILLASGPAWPGSLADPQIAERLETATRARAHERQVLFDRVQPAYAGRAAAAGRAQPPLTVLAVTSRYTTVLQYAMRDWLAAFARLGHRTHLYIEPHDHAQFSPLRLLREIDARRPDLLLIIDHLRYEYEGIIPAEIPGVCWIQDALPNLFSHQAGASVRPFEFVIGHGFPECLTTFGYPSTRFLPCVIPTNPEQMLDPDERSSDLDPYRCDVMYATNAFATHAQRHATLRCNMPEPLQRVFDGAYEELRALVRQPWFCGEHHWPDLLERAEQAANLRITSADVRHQVLSALVGMADAHLREEVLRATAAWADATGRRFHLYGNGWDHHPEYGRFARGFVAHGRALGRAFRAARICLHAGRNDPLHQRVLDGLCAGGFFLMQYKPTHAEHDLWRAVHEYVRDRHAALPLQLRPEQLPPPWSARARQFLTSYGRSAETPLHITPELAQRLALQFERGYLPSASAVWPRYGDVAYHGGQHLCQRLEHFLHNEAERRAIAAEMRAAVLERFTYDALVRQLLAFVASGLAGHNPPLIE